MFRTINETKKNESQPTLIDTMTPSFEAETQTKKVKCKNCGHEFVVTTNFRRFVFPDQATCSKCERIIGS